LRTIYENCRYLKDIINRPQNANFSRLFFPVLRYKLKAAVWRICEVYGSPNVSSEPLTVTDSTAVTPHKQYIHTVVGWTGPGLVAGFLQSTIPSYTATNGASLFIP